MSWRVVRIGDELLSDDAAMNEDCHRSCTVSRMAGGIAAQDQQSKPHESDPQGMIWRSGEDGAELLE